MTVFGIIQYKDNGYFGIVGRREAAEDRIVLKQRLVALIVDTVLGKGLRMLRRARLARYILTQDRGVFTGAVGIGHNLRHVVP